MDLFLYLGHRMLHSFTPLWRLHQYHHANEKMTVFAGNRNNSFALSVKSVLSAIPFTFLGASLNDFALAFFLTEILTYLTHSEIDADWGWLRKWVFISPRFHRIHHSRDDGNNRSNYGISLVIWDRIFGSYNAHAVVTNIGVKDVDYNRMPFLDGLFYGVRLIFFKQK